MRRTSPRCKELIAKPTTTPPGSPVAEGRCSTAGARCVGEFVKVMPTDYKRVLQERKKNATVPVALFSGLDAAGAETQRTRR